MKEQDEINELQSKIERLNQKIRNCRHDWNDPKYDSETISVADDRAGYETHGVDRWPIMSFHKEQKPRWSRECKTCGYVEYTYNEEVVSVKKAPKFN